MTCESGRRTAGDVPDRRADRRAAGGADRGRDDGRVRTRRRAVPRGRTGRLPVDPARRAASSCTGRRSARPAMLMTMTHAGPVGRRAARRGAMPAPRPAIGRAAPARADGRVFRVPSEDLGRLVERVVPVRQAHDQRRLPDDPQHRCDGAPARVARRARHAGRGARPRDQQSGGRRRCGPSKACATPATPMLDVARATGRDGRSRPSSTSRSTGCAANSRSERSPRRRRARAAWTGRKRSATGSTTTTSTTRGSSRPLLASAGADQEWLDEVEAAVGPDALECGAALGLDHHQRDAVARRADRLDQSDLEPRRRGAVVLAARPGRRSSASTSTRGSTARSRCWRRSSATSTVERDFDADVRPIEAYGAELNQVWTNLIDNAIDAMDGERDARLGDRVATATRSSSRSTDTGQRHARRCPGADLRAVLHHQGRRQGHRARPRHLATHRRRRHHGDITFDSRPGATTAVVRIPVTQANRS